MKQSLPLLLLLAACDSSFSVRDITVTHALTPIASCDGAADVIRERMADEANRSIDRYVQAELASRAQRRLYNPLGNGCATNTVQYETPRARTATATSSQPGAPLPSASPSADAGSSNTPAPAEVAGDYTGTNNQVNGVDEADIVKNDGNYVYLLADGTLQIIDAWPVASTHRLSITAIDGDPRALFVLGDRAIVFSSLSTNQNVCNAYRYDSECSYGYDCDFRGDGRGSRVTIFDISDRNAPKRVEDLEIDSSYVTARAIGNNVHIVTTHSQLAAMRQVRLAFYLDYKTVQSTCMDDAALLREATAVKNANKEKAKSAAVMPGIRARTYAANGQVAAKREVEDCGTYLVSSAPDNGDVATIISFDATGSLEAASLTSAVARPGPIYASDQALYIASRYGNEGSVRWRDAQGHGEFSTLHRFALDGAKSTYMASGGVIGRVLNQFAMDEFQGHFRVATTNGHAGGGKDVQSFMTVLSLGLEQVGQVGGLGPNEDIRSVRFMGEKAFVVTFEKTDPLFYLDLKDPTHPSVAGELKIPGFSTYIHLLDDSHLLTIGYDGDDQGSFSWFRGVMLQIFDVSTPSALKLTHKSVIGTRGSSSEALENHLAFTYFPSKKLLALPMTICEGGSGSSFGSMTFSGLLVYDVSTTTGFAQRGGLSFGEEEDPNDYGYDSRCYNWWSNASSTVQRSIFMDDYVLALSGTTLKASNVNDVGTPVTELSLDVVEDSKTCR